MQIPHQFSGLAAYILLSNCPTGDLSFFSFRIYAINCFEICIFRYRRIPFGKIQSTIQSRRIAFRKHIHLRVDYNKNMKISAATSFFYHHQHTKYDANCARNMDIYVIDLPKYSLVGMFYLAFTQVLLCRLKLDRNFVSLCGCV